MTVTIADMRRMLVLAAIAAMHASAVAQSGQVRPLQADAVVRLLADLINNAFAVEVPITGDPPETASGVHGEIHEGAAAFAALLQERVVGFVLVRQSTLTHGASSRFARDQNSKARASAVFLWMRWNDSCGILHRLRQS